MCNGPFLLQFPLIRIAWQWQMDHLLNWAKFDKAALVPGFPGVMTLLYAA